MDKKKPNKPKKILFAGYLPVFGEHVGSHPQFRHTVNTSSEYEFIYPHWKGVGKLIHSMDTYLLSEVISEKGALHKLVKRILMKQQTSKLEKTSEDDIPPVTLKSSSQTSEAFHSYTYGSRDMLFNMGVVLRSAFSFFSSAVRDKNRWHDVMQFIATRDLFSQFQIPPDVDLVFLTTWAYIMTDKPWVIEIEDPTTLFAPFINNWTMNSTDISKTFYYRLIKKMIESDNCRGIISHVRSTAENIPILFKNKNLAAKTIHIPLGVRLPQISFSGIKKANKKEIQILFTNSWHQKSIGFYVRGGIDLLEAFSIIAARYSNVRLVLRTMLPADLNTRCRKILADYPIQVENRFLPKEEIENIHLNSDIYVLPSARIHVVSILEAMAYGLAVVVSDGWGICEYVEDGKNGLVVKGRYGKCSWMDERGMLRENYDVLFSSDPVVVQGLVTALSSLIENKNLREQLGQTAKRDVETKFNVQNWDKSLTAVFGRMLS